MPSEEFDRTMSRLMTLGSVGMEMVAPIGIGIGLDFWLGSMPWLSIVGAILGFSFGIYRLIALNRPKNQ
jgi:F0F1-type ATP synthase assembly protein I